MRGDVVRLSPHLLGGKCVEVARWQVRRGGVLGGLDPDWPDTWDQEIVLDGPFFLNDPA